MKRLLYSIIFLFSISLTAFSQSWVNRLATAGTSGYALNDSLTGIINMAEGADGDLFVIANVNRGQFDYLHKVSPTGYPIRWNTMVGTGGQLTGSSTTLLAATPDSGCLIAQVNCGWSSIYHCEPFLIKYSKTGAQQWTQTNILSYPGHSTLYDMIANSSGGYYLLFEDSLISVNSGGSVILRTALIKGRKIFELPGGDLVVLSNSNTLLRTTLSGTVAWTAPCNSNSLLTSGPGYVLGVFGSTMFRIDVSNGSTTWSMPHTFLNVCSIDKTPGGGFVASCGQKPHEPHWLSGPTALHQSGDLFEVDAAGSVVWSKTYPFPHYGLSHVMKSSSGRILTGGSYIWTGKDLGFSRQYYAFLSSLDSAGSGRLESTSLTWPGDANYNSTVSFLDDALYVALAFGQTGPGRDDTIPPVFFLGQRSSFAADWSGTFQSGINHKHADSDGDGTVGASDFSVFANLPPPTGSIIVPPWSMTVVPGLALVPAQSSVAPGQNIRFYVVAGNAATPIDSIYGLAFTATYNSSLLSSTPALTLYTSDFGNPASSLIKSEYTAFGTYNGLISRINHTNALNLGDTIGEISMTASAGISSLQTLNFQITGYKALTWFESTVTLQTAGGSVTICPPPPATITAGGSLNICPGGSVVLNANTGAGLTHQWMLNSILIPGATTSSHTATAAGNYTCVVSNSCGSTTSNYLAVAFLGSTVFSIQPSSSGKDAFVLDNFPTTNLGASYELNAVAWTVNLNNIRGRAFIEFDLASFPANAVVDQALLTLYKDPTSSNANNVHSGTNAAWIRKVTASWNESTITWNNQPAATTTGQVAVPQSIASTQDYNINITSLVQDMVVNPASNFGLLLQLQSESPFSALLFASSDHPDAARHPALQIIYHVPTSTIITAGGPTSFCAGGSVLLSASGGSSYQWYRNGVLISGATAVSYSATLAGSYTCAIFNGTCSVTSNAIAVTLLTLPPASVTPVGPLSTCPTDPPVTLNANTGAGLSYQWQQNSITISGQVSSSYIVPFSGIFSCVVTNSCGSATSNVVTVTVNPAVTPTIAIVGPSQICPGNSAIFGANTYGGGATDLFDWMINGIIVYSGSNSFLITTALIPGDQVSCRMQSSAPCPTVPFVTSNTITLSANMPSASITAAGPTTICSGNSVTLNANTGTGLSYQWKLNNLNIGGATASSYTATGSGNYTCEVTNTCGSTTSNVIVVTVSGSNVFFLQPASTGKDATVLDNFPTTNLGSSSEWNAMAWTVGGSSMKGRALLQFDLASLPANAVIDQAQLSLYYDPTSSNAQGVHSGSNAAWIRKVTGAWNESTVTWNNQPAATTAGQVAVPQSTAPNQDYQLNVTALVQDMVANPITNFGFQIILDTETPLRALLFASSDHADASKHPSLRVEYHIPAVITPASSTIVCPGGSLQMNANVGIGLSYQWKLDGNNIPGATQSSYVATAAGLYTCQVTNACGSLLSNTISFSFQPRPIASISAASTLSICQGGTVRLDAIPNQRYSYQWQLDGVDIPGQTQASHYASTAGDYTCIVSDSCSSEQSNILTVSVLPPVTASISTSDPLTFCAGQTAKMEAVTAAGRTYQWKLNGTDIAGATTSTHDASLSGIYQCEVSDSCGSALSNALITSVNPLPPAVISAGGNTTFCTGGSVTLSANTGTGLTYLWRQNGSPIGGATSVSYNATTGGTYTCTVSNNCGGTLSNAIVVTVSPAPTATITAAGSTTFCTGGSVTLNANTGAGLTHQWKRNTVNIGGATASSYVATLAGSYTCTVTNSCGNTTSNAITVTVNAAPTATITAAGSTTICTGGSVTLNANTGAGLGYQWRRNGANINGATASSYAATTAGSYTCVVTNSCGSATSNAISVTTGSAPATPSNISGNNKACPSTTAVYSVTAVSGVTFNWTAPPSASVLSGQGTNTVTISFTATYNGGTLSVTASNSCGTSSARTKSIAKDNRCNAAPATPSPGSAERMLDAEVYPNPSSKHFTLRVFSPEQGACRLVIRDMTGREVERLENIIPGEAIEFGSSLSSGIYLADIQQGDQRKVLRVVKNR